MTLCRVSALVLLAASVVFSAWTADGQCVSPGGNAYVAWTSPAQRSVPRVYFRAEESAVEHYVEMSRGGSAYEAVLPGPIDTTSKIHYRIALREPRGTFVTRHRGAIAVVEDCPSRLTAAQITLARQIVIGSTMPGPAIPAGFRCDGVAARIDSKGMMSAAQLCQPALAGTISDSQKKGGAPGASTRAAARLLAPEGDSIGVTPNHHRRPRRDPIPAPAPTPRLSQPVSPARP